MVNEVELVEPRLEEAAEKLKELIESGEPFRAVFKFSEITFLGLRYEVPTKRWEVQATRYIYGTGASKYAMRRLAKEPDWVYGEGYYSKILMHTDFVIGAHGRTIVVEMERPYRLVFTGLEKWR